MSYSCTRRAVLIGCPGGGASNFLKGVKDDLKNVRRYLLSDTGGHWFDNEIITLANPTVNEALSVIHSIAADYVFVYFSGHGGTNKSEECLLSFKDQLIADTAFLNESPRQLIIIDACRKRIGGALSGIPDSGTQFFPFDGRYKSREAFDYYILNSSFGKMIVHATQDDTYSYDGGAGLGGDFTSELLNVSINQNTDHSYEPIYIEYLLELLPARLIKKGSSQVPCITYDEGYLSVPFGITITENHYQVSGPSPSIQANNNSSAQAWFAAGIVGLFILIAAGSSNK